MTENGEWQRIAEIPVDLGRLVLTDPGNVADVDDHLEEVIERDQTYELVTNEYGVAVALVLKTGIGDGTYPVEARFVEVAGVVRIAEIRITFLPHPVIGYELP